jgi:UDP-N-acetylmuramate dehydrogenase
VDEERRKVLKGMLDKNVAFDQPMERFTTFRVGGKVEAICFVEDSDSLETLLAYAGETGTPYLVVGKGSNLLVKDGGLRGLAIILRGKLATFERTGQKRDCVSAGAGLHLSGLLNACCREGLGGLEFLAGIPGTLGGAVTMNAGAWGKETGDVVIEVEMILRSGKRITEQRSNLEFSYRRLSMPPGGVIVKAGFQCVLENPDVVAQRVRRYQEMRKKTQPVEYPSGGSVFRNPGRDYAGRLIEQVGLKGSRIGGAMISTKHANFIVNTGGATAGDVLALMELARMKVKEETGVDLEPEIRVVGT